MSNTEIIWGILYSCGLIAIGAFAMWINMRDTVHSPCWGSLVDVYWESVYQETLDDPWDFDDPDVYSDFCVQTQDDDSEWRSMTQVEAHKVIWDQYLIIKAAEESAGGIE
jgi:hypothetical protein